MQIYLLAQLTTDEMSKLRAKIYNKEGHMREPTGEEVLLQMIEQTLSSAGTTRVELMKTVSLIMQQPEIIMETIKTKMKKETYLERSGCKRFVFDVITGDKWDAQLIIELEDEGWIVKTGKLNSYPKSNDLVAELLKFLMTTEHITVFDARYLARHRELLPRSRFL